MATGEAKREVGGERIWNRKFVALFIVNILTMLGNYMMRPVIANYAIELGATFAAAGAISGLAFAVATLMRPATGYFSDRLNKKTSVVIAIAAFAISSFGCALSQSMAIMALFSAVQGVALSFQAIGVTSMAALCVPPARIGSAVGWLGIAMTVSMAIGPGLAATAATWGGYRASFVIGGVFCCIALAIIVFFKAPPGARGHKQTAGEELPTHKSRAASLFSQSFYLPTIPIALAGLLAVWAPSTASSLLLTVEGTGYMSGVSWYFVAYAAIALGMRPFAGWLSDRFGSAIVAVPLLFVGMLGMIVPIFGRDLVAVIVSGLLMGAGSASASSVIQAESVRGVDSEHLGRATNTYYMGVDLGCALGVWVGGFLMQIGSPVLMFGFNAATCVMAAVIVTIALIMKRRKRI